MRDGLSDREKADQQVATLRALLARGGTLSQARAKLNRSEATLCRLAAAHDLPRRRRALSRDKERQIGRLLAKDASIRATARSVGVSTRTVWRRYHARLRAVLGELASGTPRPCTPWRCPEGGELLKVDRCIVHNTRKPPRAARANHLNLKESNQ